jgi:hypothetical protein
MVVLGRESIGNANTHLFFTAAIYSSPMSDYFEWLRSCGVTFAKDLQLKKSDTCGYGLYTTKDATSERVVVDIPADFVITADRLYSLAHQHWPVLLAWINVVCTEKQVNLQRPISNKTIQRDMLLAFLIHHARLLRLALDETDLWWMYVKWLPPPEHMDRLVAWQDVDTWLASTPLLTAVERKRKRLSKEAEQWQVWSQLARKQLTLKDDYMIKLAADITEDEVYWADAIYWSRVLELPSSSGGSYHALVPLIDMCNHSIQPNARWQVTEQGNVQLITNATSATELCISYGDKPNAELLFSHGFALADNPIPEPYPMLVPLSAGSGEDTTSFDWLAVAKQKLLQSWSISPMIQLQPPPLNVADDIDWSVLVDKHALYALYLCVLNDEEFNIIPNDEGCTWLVCDEVIETPEEMLHQLIKHELEAVMQLRIAVILDDYLATQSISVLTCWPDICMIKHSMRPTVVVLVIFISI